MTTNPVGVASAAMIFGGFAQQVIANEFAPAKYMLAEIDVIGTEQHAGAASAAMICCGFAQHVIANEFAPTPL